MQAAKQPSVLISLLMLSLTIGSASAMRTIFNPVQESVARTLGFSDFQMSLLQGVAISIPIGLLAIPVGRITDRGNRARLLFWLALLWTTGAALTVFATEFWQIFAARMLAGLGAFSAITVCMSMVADLSAPESRGRALMFISIGNMLGNASAFALGGALLGHYSAAAPLIVGLDPWRNVVLVFASVSLLLALALLTIREPARREQLGGAAIDLSTTLSALWERRTLLAPLFVGQLMIIMADAAATIWAAPVLERFYGASPAAFGAWMGLVILGSGIVGAVIGGVASDLGHRSKIKGGILFGAVAAAVLSIPGAFFALMPTISVFAAMLCLLLACGAVTGLVTSAAITVLVPNELRGVCISTFVVVGAIVGFGVAPTLVTLIADSLGGNETLRYGLAITSASTSAIAAIGFATALLRARKA